MPTSLKSVLGGCGDILEVSSSNIIDFSNYNGRALPFFKPSYVDAGMNNVRRLSTYANHITICPLSDGTYVSTGIGNSFPQTSLRIYTAEGAVAGTFTIPSLYICGMITFQRGGVDKILVFGSDRAVTVDGANAVFLEVNVPDGVVTTITGSPTGISTVHYSGHSPSSDGRKFFIRCARGAMSDNTHSSILVEYDLDTGTILDNNIFSGLSPRNSSNREPPAVCANSGYAAIAGTSSVVTTRPLGTYYLCTSGTTTPGLSRSFSQRLPVLSEENYMQLILREGVQADNAGNVCNWVTPDLFLLLPDYTIPTGSYQSYGCFLVEREDLEDWFDVVGSSALGLKLGTGS